MAPSHHWSGLDMFDMASFVCVCVRVLAEWDTAVTQRITIHKYNL